MTAYTHGHDAVVLDAYRWRTAANSAAYLLPHLRPGADLLDVGCGPGSVTADLAALVAPGRVTGVDRAPGALARLRAEADRRGVAVTAVAGDATALPLPAGAVDVAHAHQVLHHVADPVAVLREMRRVVRPGGLVAVRETDWSGYAWYPRVPALDDWLDLLRGAVRRAGGEPDAGRRLASWARAAGFTDVTASADVWCFASPEERAFWGGQWARRVTETGFARTAVASGAATRAGLDRIADGWRAWAADDGGWFAVLHGSVLCRV